jgi:hypothetical protein
MENLIRNMETMKKGLWYLEQKNHWIGLIADWRLQKKGQYI